MELFIGLVLGLVFFICLSSVFFLGYRLGNKINKPKSSEPSQEEIKKAQQMIEGFQNIMNYNVETAMQRRLRDE